MDVIFETGRAMSDQDDPKDKGNLPPEDEQQTPPPSRLDRLISARSEAEEAAARWAQAEQSGEALPSQDAPLASPEPPVMRLGDEQASEPQAARRKQRPTPSFPHPTDPAPPPPVPATPSRQALPPEDDDLPFRLGTTTPADLDTPSGGATPLPQQSPPPPAVPTRPPQRDLDQTQVAPSAFADELPPFQPEATIARPAPTPSPMPAAPGGGRAGLRSQPASPPPPYAAPTAPAGLGHQGPPAPPKQSRKAARRGFRVNWGLILRLFVLLMVAGIVMAVIGAGAASIYYVQVTQPVFANIDDIGDLQARSLQFETTRIRDRDGNVLYQINDPNGGLRDTVSLQEVSPWIIVATVATEEREYFTNPGFSIPGIIRAVVQNFQEGETVSGASTITQQVTRTLLLPDELATERSYRRKIIEIFLAAELNRRFSKEEILELYLNQNYYSNLSYGIEAASRTYFSKPASDLTLAEAAYLAGLPQAPAVWDPVYNREAIIEPRGRLDQVLGLMLEAGCINTGDSSLDLSQYCTTSDALVAAGPQVNDLRTREFQAVQLNARYPHWVVYVQQLLEADPTIGPAIYTSGFDVYTTLDPRIQDVAEQQVREVLATLTDRNVNNASVVVIDADTGAILAMVGSADFNNDAINGQVNIALTPQQPGSSIKPFTYLTAFRKGWGPATMIWDVPIEYEIPGFGIYEPVNYDGRFHGPQTVRASLANSYNVPAVLALDYVGVPALLQTLNDLGISSLGDSSNPNQYGLSLTLGAGEVYLLEWANAYATLGNGGVYHPTYAIERIERDGQPVEGWPYQVPEGEQRIQPEHAFLLASIMSDHAAREPAFGVNSILNTPYPGAAKTGTTNDFRDNWTMGFTSEVAVGVWVGNTDNSPMLNVTGVTGAGPIWRGVMDAAAQWYVPQPFTQPPSVYQQTVCADDATSPPSDYCQEFSDTRTDFFAIAQPPLPPEQGIYRAYRIDPFTGLIQNEFCNEFPAEERAYLVLPNPSQLIDVAQISREWLLNSSSGQEWAAARGLTTEGINQTAPTEACTASTERPVLLISSPAQGSDQQGLIPVIGTARVPNFRYYTVEYGLGENPGEWIMIQGQTSQIVENGGLAQIDLAALPDGPVTLRLLVYGPENAIAEARVTFSVRNPTPSPTPTGAPTATPTATSPATSTSPATATTAAPATETQSPAVSSTP